MFYLGKNNDKKLIKNNKSINFKFIDKRKKVLRSRNILLQTNKRALNIIISALLYNSQCFLIKIISCHSHTTSLLITSHIRHPTEFISKKEKEIKSDQLSVIFVTSNYPVAPKSECTFE